MVMGVAYWMLPRPGGIRQPRLEALTFLLLQAGMLTRVIGEPWWRATGSELAHALFSVSGGLVFGAVVAFAVAMRERVVSLETLRAAARPRGSRPRPAQHLAAAAADEADAAPATRRHTTNAPDAQQD